MLSRYQAWLAVAAIVVAATGAIWVFLLPDEPRVVLGDSAAAALVASTVLLGKLRRDHWNT